MTLPPVPGAPQELQLVGRSQTMLNISWLEPLEKNGRLLQFQLEVSETEPGRRRRQIPVARTFTIPARQRDGRTSDGRWTPTSDPTAARGRLLWAGTDAHIPLTRCVCAPRVTLGPLRYKWLHARALVVAQITVGYHAESLEPVSVSLRAGFKSISGDVSSSPSR